MIGSILGDYRILDKLGQGGMGEVYTAEDNRLRRIVAIKMLRSDGGASPAERQRLLLEARAASALNHPNIVQIYEFDTQAGQDFIVMEFVDGQTLAKVLSEKRLTIDEVLHYTGQIVSA